MAYSRKVVYGEAVKKFKRGDTVKVLNIGDNRSSPYISKIIGKEFIVENIEEGGCISLTGFSGFWYRDRFEIVDKYDIFEGIDFSV